jgi:hypothetical protein
MAPSTNAAEPLTYLLRDIDAEMWTRFRERAAADGFTARALLLYLARAYADGDVTTQLQLAPPTRRRKGNAK